MEINYRTDITPPLGDIIEVYKSSGIIRPINDSGRIRQMFDNANLIVTAWHNGQLVGIARSLTDFCYCCYLSDLAVSKPYQHQGIGKALVKLTNDTLGDTITLILLAAPAAINYYGKIGMAHADNCFLIRRTR